MSLRPRARHTAGHPTSTPHNHNTACADLGSGIYSMHFFKNSATLFNATAILAPSRHHAGTCHTVGQTQHTPLRHAGGPEALLRVLCRYLKRVSDRSPPTTDQCRHNGDAPSCSTESEAWLHVWRIDGMGVGGSMGRWKGRGYKRRYPHPPLRVDPHSRAPAGPGPSPPFVPPRPPSSVQHCLAHPPAPNNLPRCRCTYRYTVPVVA